MTNFVDIKNWEEELFGHPAFLESMPLDGEVSDAVAALQAMKYDDDDDTLEEKALVHKTDGNKYFKLKTYKYAIDSYTEGIKIRCADKELNCELYGNRAACHVRIGNYRSAFKDCYIARKFNPDHVKVLNRGVDCLMKLQNYDLALQWIADAKVLLQGDSKEVTRLMLLEQEATKLKKLKDRDERKSAVQMNKTLQERSLLLSMMEDRDIHMVNSEDERVPFHSSNPANFDMAMLDVDLPPSAYDNTDVRQIRVRVDKRSADHPLWSGMNYLMWPVVLIYPEVNETDFIQGFDEMDTFESHLSEMFADAPPWDINQVYQKEDLSVYFESGVDFETLIKVPIESTLKSVLSDSRFRLKTGLPGFIVLSLKAKFSVDYLNKLSVKSLL